MSDLRKEILGERDYQSIVVTETRHHSGSVLSSHAHESPLLVLVTHGEYAEAFGRGREEKCVPGMLRYLPATVVHADRFYAGAQGLTIQFDPSIVGRLKDLTVLESRPGKLTGGAFDHLGRQFLMEYHRADEWSPLAFECLVTEVLIEMSRRRLQLARGSPALLWARDLLHEGAGGPLRLAEIAQQVGLHPAQLSRDFRQMFGETMSDYLRRVRIQRAQVILRQPQIPLSEVGILCGFHDQSHFYHSFKKA